MNILVTGAAGFIGSHLAERLVEVGHAVRGLDCLTDNYARVLKELNAKQITEKGVEFFYLDLAQDELKAAVQDVDMVFHFAAQPGLSATASFESYVRNNMTATYRLLEALKDVSSAGSVASEESASFASEGSASFASEGSASFASEGSASFASEGSASFASLRCLVNIATSSVYGAQATGDERSEPKPTSYYGVTKLAAEQLVLSYWRDKGLPACSVRLFSVYGPRERPEKLYPKLIRSLLEGHPFPLYEGSEHHTRSYTYVSDIIDGLIAILDNLEPSVGEIFNIGTDQAITTGEGIRIVEEIIGKSIQIERKPRRAGDQLKTHANIEKARRILAYNPTTTPQEGLEKTVQWYKKHIFGKVDF